MKLKKIIAMVVAVSENNVIGKDNAIPWKMPTDMKFFKELTTDGVVIMGRKTFESMGSKPLPNRINIVITKDCVNMTLSEKWPGVTFVSTVDMALKSAQRCVEKSIFIIGGKGMYEECLQREDVDFLIMSRIHADVEGDVQFPEFSRQDWRPVHESQTLKGEKDQYPFHIAFYKNDMHANRVCEDIISKHSPFNTIKDEVK